MSTAPGELLESPPARSFAPWIAIAVLAVLTLVGWNVFGSGPDPLAPTTIAIPQSPDVQPEPLPESDAVWEDVTSADYVSQLSFLDETTGFAILNLCSQVGYQRNEPCARRLLATTDAGVSWETRARIPILGEGFNALVPVSDLEVTLVDQANPTRMLLSADGGRSWVNVAVSSGPPAVMSEGGVLLPSYPVACRAQCQSTITWIDPATQRSRELPAPPPVAGTMALQPWRAPDGDIVVARTDSSPADVAMSTDGGQTWTETRLGESSTVQGTWVLPAGAGRAYAFVYVGSEFGAIRVETYRTDDGGTSWTDITADQPQPDLNSGATIDGELIGTSSSGVVLISSNGGTVWTELPNTPALGYVEASRDGRALVGYPVNDWSGELYFSLDRGTTWSQLAIPPDPPR